MLGKTKLDCYESIQTPKQSNTNTNPTKQSNVTLGLVSETFNNC